MCSPEGGRYGSFSRHHFRAHSLVPIRCINESSGISHETSLVKCLVVASESLWKAKATKCECFQIRTAPNFSTIVTSPQRAWK
jgi:hypothetical protein